MLALCDGVGTHPQIVYDSDLESKCPLCKLISETHDQKQANTPRRTSVPDQQAGG
jgi:phage FluMu protein Com